MAADAIHFKDGMRTVCHGRAWEENNTVFCEYDGGILSYPKADVDRVEKGPAPVPPPDEPSAALQPSLPAAPPSRVPPVYTALPFHQPLFGLGGGKSLWRDCDIQIKQ